MDFHIQSANKLLRMMTSENLRSADNVPSVKKRMIHLFSLRSYATNHLHQFISI